jgi:hypothetical protein
MLAIERVDPGSRAQVHRFVRLPYRLYAGQPQWVPPLDVDLERRLDRRHPFYDHSDAAFFLAVRDGRDAGRVAALDHRPFNAYHGTRRARFCLFECDDDPAAAAALFEQVDAWAKARGLTEVVGPQGFGAFDGYGLLVAGFEHRQTMTMAGYNPPYYPRLIETIGFTKEVDFDSWLLSAGAFRLPERVQRIAERARRRGRLQVHRFRTMAEVRGWAERLREAYNAAFRHNWEYAPLTSREVAALVDALALVSEPGLIAVITHAATVVGFLLAFPDISAALQRARGHLRPWTLLDLLIERRRTRRVALNGLGILPGYRGLGGDALLFAEIDHLLRQRGFQQAEVTQVAETAVQMRRELELVGASPYKRHRVYARPIR